MIERILDLTVLVGILVVGLLALRSAAIPVAYVDGAVALAALGLSAWIVLLLCGKRLEDALVRLSRHRMLANFTCKWTVEEHLRHFFSSMSVLRDPSLALQVLTVSFVVWFFEGAIFVVLAMELGYRGQWLGPWFALATGTLSTLFPSSPGYIGTFDFFTASGFAAYGASHDCAGAVTLLVHFVLWVPLTVTGLVYVLLPRSKAHRHRVAASFTKTQ